MGWSHGGIGAIENGAFVSLPGDAATELIGQAVLDMSETYRPDASLLSKDALRRLYKLIGAKSQADIYRRAEIVHGAWSLDETAATYQSRSLPNR